MKKITILIAFLLMVSFSFAQTPEKKSEPTVKQTPKKENVKTVPKSQQKKSQIKKTQIKKTQIQNKKKKQIMRKAKAVRRKRNG